MEQGNFTGAHSEKCERNIVLKLKDISLNECSNVRLQFSTVCNII